MSFSDGMEIDFVTTNNDREVGKMSDPNEASIENRNHKDYKEASSDEKTGMHIMHTIISTPKYGQCGVVITDDVKLELLFMDGEKTITIDLDPMPESTYKEVCGKLIDSYFDKKGWEPVKPDKVCLYYWYFRRIKEGVIIKGRVSGHSWLTDSSFITTSLVSGIDEGDGELLVHTQNTLYHLPYEYCDFARQDKDIGIVPNYSEMAEKYRGVREEPTIEDGKVLLVISNFDEYYFHSGYYKDPNEDAPRVITGSAHVGMSQDSFLVRDVKYSIDLRYFPHYGNIEFYAEHTGESSLFIENIGNATLYVRSSCGTLRLDPMERKEVCKDNVEESTPYLAGGDLYPAGFF